MAKQTKSNGVQAPSTNGHQPPNRPTIEQLRRIHEEGVEQTLLSGIPVMMRPVRIEVLLASGHVPDILTPLMLKGLYENINDDLTDFVAKPRDGKEETLEMLRSVDAVCAASLVDPSIVPYLELPDRMWIFKLAFQPAEVLSSFRLRPEGDVVSVDEGEQVPQAAQRDH